MTYGVWLYGLWGSFIIEVDFACAVCERFWGALDHFFDDMGNRI